MNLLERLVGQNVARDDEEDVDHGTSRVDDPNEGQLERGRRGPVLVQTIRLSVPAQILLCIVSHHHNERGDPTQAIEVRGRVEVGFGGRGTQPWLEEARYKAKGQLLEDPHAGGVGNGAVSGSTRIGFERGKECLREGVFRHRSKKGGGSKQRRGSRVKERRGRIWTMTTTTTTMTVITKMESEDEAAGEAEDD